MREIKQKNIADKIKNVISPSGMESMIGMGWDGRRITAVLISFFVFWGESNKTNSKVE